MNNSKSAEWNVRLNQVIPGGSSTGSKAPIYMPEEPGVIVKGKGCRVWDADGNEYIDFRNGLGPITLGYQFPEMNEAIQEQLSQGIIFGHPHPLECEVAELLTKHIPCAERVRFLKTGGEAIAATIRIARHYTGRAHIIQIGYNGWVNSLAEGGVVLPGLHAMTVPGVPKPISDLHHAAAWNDLAGIEELFQKYEGQIAAVVIAASYAHMAEGKTFYPAIRELTKKHGSLLIYDEIVTGFRIAIGGVQEYFGVVPDLAVFSKGIANGMPLSAFVGKKEVMDSCNKGGVSISSTFSGETLSLAAAKACINIYERENVVKHLWDHGEFLWTNLNKLFEQYEIALEVQGFWPCPHILPKADADDTIVERFFRAAYKYGVSLYNVSYVNFSHKKSDIEETLHRLEQACQEI